MPGIIQRQSIAFVYSFIAALGTYVSLYSYLDILHDRVFQGTQLGRNSFDFIIVGSGSSGAVVANRLSEHYNVLLLEAGGHPMPLTYIPTMASLLLNYPEIDWMHLTVPQTGACLAAKNHQSSWSQGKGLGGTSQINSMIQSRGCPRDYDNWAKVLRDPRWSYDGVLPFFKKIEDFHGIYENTSLHGKGGPMNVEVTPEKSNSDVFVWAGQDLGYPRTDLNGRFTQGFDTVYYNIRNGQRHSTYSAYLVPITYRKTLTIEKFAHVNKVLIDESGRAIGVEYDRHFVRKQAFASKEVIISAGVNSPKLLMLSGIGPKQHLEQHKIEVKYDSPMVGQNVQDHISIYLGPFFTNPKTSQLLDRDASVVDGAQFVVTGNGLVTSSTVHALAFISTPNAKLEGLGDWADIQLLYTGLSIYKDFAKHVAHSFNMNASKLEKYYAHAAGKDSVLILTSLARPVQRGEILLKSGNPYDTLHIDPKYLQNEKDIQVFVQGVKMAVDLVEKSQSFQRIGGRFTTQAFPGCENVEFRSDAYWECFIRQYTISLHHIVGACAMGPDGSNSVVDTEMRVRGIKNLRVIDASVMPVVPVGNTHVPSIMIGEKGADFILKQWAMRKPKH